MKDIVPDYYNTNYTVVINAWLAVMRNVGICDWPMPFVRAFALLDVP